MKNKSKILFYSILTLLVSGISPKGNCQCTDQNNNTIHCLYLDITGKYYKIDENNNRHLYSPEDGDTVLELQPKKEFFSDGSVLRQTCVADGDDYYVYDKNNVEYKYSPETFQRINSKKFKLYTVIKKGDIVALRPNYDIQEPNSYSSESDNDSDKSHNNESSNSKESTSSNTDNEEKQYLKQKRNRSDNDGNNKGKRKIFNIVKDKKKLANKNKNNHMLETNNYNKYERNDDDLDINSFGTSNYNE